MSEERPLVAVTGASGFLGSHIVAALARSGLRLRLLARSDPWLPSYRSFAVPGFAPEVVRGDLADRAALETLTSGADAIIHCAGIVKSVGRAAFMSANAQGTRNLAEAAQRHAPHAHLIIVSSLAAREPHLSDYAASKRAGEKAAREAFAGRVTIVRPPALYGPGDGETLALFKLARLPLIPLAAGRGRVDFMHVADAAAALAALAVTDESQIAPTAFFALSSPNPGGYTKFEILSEAAAAMGLTARFLPIPGTFLKAAALVLSLSPFRRPRMLTPGKAREILHFDWGIHPSEMPPSALPKAKTGLPEGFAATVDWYRNAGWLSR